MKIYSLNSEFAEINELMKGKIVSILSISKNKLDASFWDTLFKVADYNFRR